MLLERSPARNDSHQADRGGTTRKHHDDRSRIAWPDPEDAGAPSGPVKVDIPTARSVVRFTSSCLVSDVVEPRAPDAWRAIREEEAPEDRFRIRAARIGTSIDLPAIRVRTAIRPLLPVKQAEKDAVTEKENQR
ncbi:hypothetical protein [Stappia indica]|uniref:hypothetical protein n=1 Tax=Stappia indica TaxID=538381 RepID=UPI001D18E6CC|nr:hypothetical protein [Stappia indica]MCC4243190.1 hypothetical protein [Stappia indica]